MTIMYSKARELFDRDYKNSQEFTSAQSTKQRKKSKLTGNTKRRVRKK
ncbi:hypothetical protein N781_13270 [Pontibacillus halophilus JSM 076056 = DSM 19796]|uniref:Uncharacterized protein n=1 Tax=Pontibacillus halophilus JSM 076056 = DSM 19796 TaxID=1385510 RepID=A0A0A5GNN1_9BACI|nr:hypothetical protein [Pontibacillus halophilus]KGX92858.1 hypothetical protein N781_13270 [Pontibacillus halophilus JSM 076056 = DSM 19796]